MRRKEPAAVSPKGKRQTFDLVLASYELNLNDMQHRNQLGWVLNSACDHFVREQTRTRPKSVEAETTPQTKTQHPTTKRPTLMPLKFRSALSSCKLLMLLLLITSSRPSQCAQTLLSLTITTCVYVQSSPLSGILLY